jgi:4-hydroxybenzoyl-CoA thioesterase
MAETFVRDKRIGFHDCDPAGIVFYPQYFVMFHELMETWFNEALGEDYAAFVRSGHGLPTVKIDCEFMAPNPLGDVIALELAIAKLGQASITFRYMGRARGMDCVRATIVSVHSSLQPLKAVAIPQNLRSKMERFVVAG